MKALILARVSTDKQQLDSQIEKLTNEAIRFGYRKDDITIISGKESGVKLDIEERQTINQMKSLIDTGEYNMVFIWEVSRLARRPKVLYEVREWLIERKVNLHCMTPQFTMLKDDFTIDPTASIVFALFGTMAEEEARLSKERMSRGKRHKQAMGGYIGGKPLWGYKFENDKLTIDYAKSEIVKKIYNMYESGLSTRSIALELMATGEIKQSNLNNANKQIQMILTRPEYYGGESEISNYKYPRIITKAQFEKCRELAKDKSKEHTRVKHTCLGKRLIYSKDNGYALTPNVKTMQYRLYTIDKKYNMTIKIDLMDKIIWETVLDHANKNTEEDDKAKEMLEKESYILLRKVQQSMRMIEDLKKQIDRIEQRIIEGKMSDIKGDKMIKEKMIEMNLQQDIFDKSNYLYAQKQEQLHEGTYKPKFELMDIQERQMTVRKYIDRILLEKSGIKRGHYIIEIRMKNGIIYKYSYWSSGPWNHVEKIES